MRRYALPVLFSLTWLAVSYCFAAENLDSEKSAWIPPAYELVWSDEFQYEGRPDPSRWGFEYGFIRNQEAQYYTDALKNARVESGVLILETHREEVPNAAYQEGSSNWRHARETAKYTAPSITTRGHADWQYGIIEVRARLPRGRGMWPAIWMLSRSWGEVPWPRCGEIDIMEHVGYEPDVIHGTVHTEAYNHMIRTQKGGEINIEDPYDTFHDYAIEWTPEKIDFLLNGEVYFTVENEFKTEAEWPFDQPYHLKLNIAVGGGWGGRHGIDDSVFPQQMVVEHVRVYQKK